MRTSLDNYASISRFGSDKTDRQKWTEICVIYNLCNQQRSEN